MKWLFILPVLAMASCQPMVSQDTTLKGVEFTCASATAALKTAIVFNDKLSPPTRLNITKAVNVMRPICSQDTIPTVDSTARAALDGALSQLQAAAAEAQK